MTARRMGEMVTIPREEHERLVALAEDAEDGAAVARVRARLAAGEEEAGAGGGGRPAARRGEPGRGCGASTLAKRAGNHRGSRPFAARIMATTSETRSRRSSTSRLALS